MHAIKKYGIWVAIVLAGAAFIAAGSAKLSGVEMMHQSFADMGLPSWFGYFIGACEVAGGIGLFIRPLSGLAALGLACIMLGALYYHITFPPVSAGVPSAVLLIIVALIFSVRRKDMLKLG
ncbi:MAG: DoxX family protein [Pseudomonadota bacterium]